MSEFSWPTLADKSSLEEIAKFPKHCSGVIMPVQNFARNLDLTIEADKDGQHFIVFPNRSESLVAPEPHAEKMEWIRNSFDSFIEHVRDRNVFRRHAPYN